MTVTPLAEVEKTTAALIAELNQAVENSRAAREGIVNRSRDKGTAWNTAIVNFLIASGVLHAERRALHGATDKGDVSGIPGVVVEAKNEKRISLAEYLDEANKEAANANARIGVAWFKRRLKTNAGDGYVLMDGHTFVRLLRDAGYIPAEVEDAA